MLARVPNPKYGFAAVLQPGMVRCSAVQASLTGLNDTAPFDPGVVLM
jgi:hypothetical protein